MIPYVAYKEDAIIGVPRVGGGDPAAQAADMISPACSPRRRG